MKSADQLELMVSPTASGAGCRLGSRFLPRRRQLSFSSQYTRQIRLWFHAKPRRLISWNSLPKPRSGYRSDNSSSTMITSSS